MNFNLKKIKKLAKNFLNTPIHPQWFTSDFSSVKAWLSQLSGSGLILDIGCAGSWPKNYLKKNYSYIGLDYYSTATRLYHTKPDIFGDAHLLPIAPESIEVVLLIEVIEHLEDPHLAIREIERILKPKGQLIISFPFLYPIHDEPRDFSRISKYGFYELCKKFGFVILKEEIRGTPSQTSALLANIATCKIFISWLKNKNPLGLFILFLPLIVLYRNLKGSLISRISTNDDFMPFGYFYLVEKDTKK